VYICICNALTDADIRRASSAGAQRPAEVFQACKCRAQCGTCIRSVCSLIGLRLSSQHDVPTPIAAPAAA
jgi:bacterioferritin-associated ferredoxin